MNDLWHFLFTEGKKKQQTNILVVCLLREHQKNVKIEKIFRPRENIIPGFEAEHSE